MGQGGREVGQSPGSIADGKHTQSAARGWAGVVSGAIVRWGPVLERVGGSIRKRDDSGVAEMWLIRGTGPVREAEYKADRGRSVDG
jgi:hypothetical protein